MDKETKTAAEIAAEMQTKLDAAIKEASEAKSALAELEKNSAKAEDLEAANNKIKEHEAKASKLTESLSKLSEQINEIKMDRKDYPETVSVNLKSAIVEVLTKDDFKTGKTYEVKVSTADVITPITNSQIIPGVDMPRTRPLAFMPEFTMRTVMQDKDTIVWVEGSYASNVGYVNEGQAQSTDDTAGGGEKSRQLAKISAKIKVTAEMYEDKAFIADMLQTEMYQKALEWLDKELFIGAGADADGKKDKFYGLKTHATQFSATKAGVATSIATPSLSDLVDAVKLQGQVIDVTDATKADIGGFTINLLYVNPVDAMKWRNTKDSTGQYLLTKLSDGSQVMGGIRTIESKVIPANSLLAMESGLAELWVKRNFEIKAGQEGNDMSTDQYTIVLFMRGQSLVKPMNLPGVIYVPDITAALTAITKS